MTALFNDIIFGPIHSRRLGLSLGVNLLPTQSKICNFDCVYCECGWNAQRRGAQGFNNKTDVINILETKLREMVSEGTPPDVITFAGNGEPTMHPDFEEVIDVTLALRDKIVPNTKVSVLSNATRLNDKSVCRALSRVDNNILKLDSAFDETARLINNPNSNQYSIDQVVEGMLSFNGELIVQTMFLRGEYNGQRIDNTTDREVEAWLALIKKISPRQVMVYSLDRDTPCDTLEKVEKEELQKIATFVKALGIKCMAA